MDFAINTNLSAFQVYESLSKINSNTQKAQLRLATMKRINSVADDTSGFKVGTTLQGQNAIKKADLNNGSSALNYISTAESSLQLITEKLNQISAKYTDSLDPLKSKTSIAKDINSLADEIDSILKNTKINGSNLLEQADGTELAGNAVFGVGGDIIMDFASSSYLKVEDLNVILNGGTLADPGVSTITGTEIPFDTVLSGPNQINSTLTINYDDGSSESTGFTLNWDGNDAHITQIDFEIETGFSMTDARILHNHGSSNTTTYITIDALNGKKITSVSTTPDGGVDVAGVFGINREDSGSTTGGLRSTDADTVLEAASDIEAVTDNVKAALGRIGNLSQTLESRTEFLTSSIANNTALISKLFDADMAMEQLNATKGSIGGQVGLSMLLQVNTAPQQLLSLFR
jgi:flagellin-like hook-associated protein FlgL